METGEKIRLVRVTLNLSQDEFAAPLGVKGGQISAVEKGRNKPSESVMRLLFSEYRVSRRWWDKGEGEMFVKKEQPTLEATAEKVGIKNDIVLTVFARLSPEDQVKHLQLMLQDLPPLKDTD